MPDILSVNSSDLLRRLNRLATQRGWDIELTESGGHTRVRLNERRSTVPRHEADLKTGALCGILKQPGLTERDLEF
jgi:predicted RNA binding protein YcfA (HicA-like mRNA interferase family)